MSFGEPGDEPTIKILPTKRYTARKDYVCDACGTLIKKGDRYQRIPIKDFDENKFYSVRYHLVCPGIDS